MPSKGKKSSSSSSSSKSDRSPIPRTSSTPRSARRPESDNSSSDELHLRDLLSQASTKFPTFIGESALVGRISDQDSDFAKRNQAARVWLSEPAMVSATIAPGSLVSVSLPAPDETPLSNFPLDSLVQECARYFGVDVGDNNVNEVGNYFAIATVFPSRKVLKNGVRLSWGLSCTMGFPASGRSIFVSPVRSSEHLNKNDGIACLYLHKCKDLYLNLVLPAVPVTTSKGLSGNDTLMESSSVTSENGMDSSPKTPSFQPKLSSPSATPVLPKKPHDFISRPDTSICSDVSTVRLALADEKANELLQASAARWLYGRYLLSGNIVTVPLIFGNICAFLVEGGDKLLTCRANQDLMHKEKDDILSHEIQVCNSRQEADVALLVDTKTNVHLSDPMSPVSEKPSKAGLPKEDLSCKVTSVEEACDIPRLGGLSKEFADLKEIIMFSLANKGNLPRYKGVLLHGPPGTGKTSLASACARDAGASLFSINGPEIVSEYYGESEQKLYEVFDSARQAAPAVVFIDELDAIAPTRKDGGEELSIRLVATLLKLMDEIKRDDGILLIAATNRPDSIDPAMRRPGRLDREIEIGVPSPGQRLDILRTLLSRMDHSLSNTEVEALASETHGFVGADLAALCNEAAMTTLRHYIKFTNSCWHLKNPCWRPDGFGSTMHGSQLHRTVDGQSVDLIDSLSSSLSELTVTPMPISPVSSQRVHGSGGTSLHELNRTNGVEEVTLLKVTAEDFSKAKMKVRPSAMREVMLELPKVRWEDVGGQEKVKQQLIEAVLWPQMHPEAFEGNGIRPPRGLLMIGPPGCSKTLMARAVASEAKLNFLAVNGPELFSKYVGDSEKAVKSTFAIARANSPSIIFFDEIDGLAISRGQENDGTSVADRVLSQLLVEMDGLEQRVGVTVIAATNRPDKIDSALLRPGRFDRLVDVQPPDETDRQDIFRIHTRKTPCHPDVSMKELAQLTEGYTGADIMSICRKAALSALEESLETREVSTDLPKKLEVSMRHFKIAIGKVHPTDVQYYSELATQFRRFVDSRFSRDG